MARHKKREPLTNEQRKLIEDYYAKYPHPAKFVAFRDQYTFRRLEEMGMNLEEVDSICWYAITRAASNFDPNRGTSFSTLACFYALKECQNKLRDMLDRTRCRSIKAFQINELHEQNVKSKHIYCRQEQSQEIQEIHKAVDSLGKRDRMVVRMRCGLSGRKPKTLTEISGKLKVSRERTRQIFEKARERLKEKLESRMDGVRITVGKLRFEA